MRDGVRASVVIVSGTNSVQTLAANALDRFGVESISARTLEEAVRLLAPIRQSRRLVLVDVDTCVPGLGGADVLARANGLLADVPRLVLTSLPTSDLVRHAIQTGVVDILVLPCSIERLADALTRALPPSVTRRFERVRVELPTHARFADVSPRFYACRIDDLSPAGARLALTSLINGGDPLVGMRGHLEIDLADGGDILAVSSTIVRSIAPGQMGLLFTDVSTDARRRLDAYYRSVSARQGWIMPEPSDASELTEEHGPVIRPRLAPARPKARQDSTFLSDLLKRYESHSKKVGS